MTKRSPIIQEIMDVVRNGQTFDEADFVEYLKPFETMPDAIFVTFVVSFFENKPKTDWKLMMAGLERLLKRNSDDEQVRVITQHILEPLADLGTNKGFDRELIKPHLGSISREYLNAYEALHGSKYKY